MTLALHGKSRERQWMLVIVGVLAILGAVMSAIAVRGDAKADHAASTPVAGSGTVPYYVPHTGNLSCAELDDHFAIAGTSWSEVKFQEATLVDGAVLAGPDGKTVTLDITSADGAPFRFSWTSEFGIDAVFVKQASNPGDSNIYVYQGLGANPGAERFSDTGLGPANNVAGVSHISFCYDGNTPPPADPSVTVAKSHESTGGSTEPYGPGETFDWVITVSVTDGPTTAPVVISDTIDSRLTIGTIALGVFDCNVADQDVSCTLQAGAATGDYTLRIPVTVDPLITQCGVVENTVTISGDNVGTPSTADDSVTTECAQVLDPTVDKTYSGNDGESYSWTVEITNPNNAPIQVRLDDTGAQLVTPSVCVETIGTNFDCTIPSGGATVNLFTPIGQHDRCLPFTNTATITFDGREVDTDSANAEPIQTENCNPVTYQVCKVIAEGSATTSGTFTVSINGVEHDITVNGTGEANINCTETFTTESGTEVQILELRPEDWDVPGYTANGAALVIVLETATIYPGENTCFDTAGLTREELAVDDTADCVVVITNNDPQEPQIPIEICKVWEDNGDNVDGAAREFSFTVESQYVGTVEIVEDRSDCITIMIDYPDGSITVGEVIGDFENVSGYPKVIVESPGQLPQETTGESVLLAFGNDPIGCTILQVVDYALIQAQVIGDTPWCTITFVNREPGVDSNVTVDKRHAPAGPFEPGDSFSWFIDVIVTGDPTTGATAITDSIPLPFIAGNFVIEAPITCDFANGALVQCSLPAGTAAGTYTIEVPVTVSPDLTGQQCTTYTNVATITGHDVVGTPIQNGDIPTYTTSDTDGVIVECGNVAEDTFIEVIKLTFSQHNGGPLVATPNDDDGWQITVSSANCGVNQTKATDANGHAVFDNLPICNDYVVSENVVNASAPGYVPASPATITGVTGGQTVTFTNVRRTFDPGCTNIADCGPTTSTPTTPPTSTPVPTETPVPPTNTPTNTPPASATNPPETAIAGERTPGGASTPIAPSTGSGMGGSLATGMNLLLVVAGLLALSGGLILATAGRRR